MKTLLTAAGMAAALVAFAPESHAQSAPKYFFQGDMVRGQLCVLNNQFKRKETVVFRVRVSDPQGHNLDDKGLKTVTLQLSDGKSLPMHFGTHPRGQNTDTFWTISWVIPEDYPTGTLTYKITAASADGQSESWSPFNVKPSQLTVVE